MFRDKTRDINCMNTTLIRILLVDDHTIVRESWKMILEKHPQFNVVAECANGQDAITQSRELTPDIVLLDVNVSPIHGLGLTQKILEAAPSTRVIGLSVNNTPRFAYRVLEAGAHGYITKTSSLDEIHQGILEVHDGHQYVCEEIRRHGMNQDGE
jgi:Response regulator containing a CheY-like receiver domain and an HTH DNA-binding domain